MKPLHRFTLTLTLLLLLVAGQARAQQPGPDELDAWLESVVLLVTGSSWCAGVVIDDQGTVATAYHCLASGRRTQVRTRDGRRFLGRAQAAQRRADLALLVVPELAGEVPARPLREEPLRPGEPIWALGHPFAPLEESNPLLGGTLKWSVSHGIVSAVGEKMLQVDCALNPGNSGGPLVDGRGQVAGIASRRLRADNLAFAAPATGLVQLLEEPEWAPLGGSWGAELTSLQSLVAQRDASLGLLLRLVMRDRLVLSLGPHLPIGQRWSAASSGSTRWVAGELMGQLRLRAGRGRWSLTLDGGGGVVLLGGLVALEDVAGASFVPDDYLAAPALQGGLGMGGVTLRGIWLREPDRTSIFIGLNYDFPGVLGVF